VIQRSYFQVPANFSARDLPTENVMKRTGKLLLVLGISLSAVAATPVYKWVDPDGVVHYLETPPENVACETLGVEDPLSEEQIAVARGIYEQVITDLAARRAAHIRARQEQRMSREQREMVSDYLADKCVKALRHLMVLGIERPVYYDDAGEIHCERSMHSSWYEGERRYLNDDERSVLELIWSDQVLKFCTAEPSEKEIDKRVDAWMRMRTRQHCDQWKVALTKARKPEQRTPASDIEKLETQLERYCY
jgi:hypothetical protein